MIPFQRIGYTTPAHWIYHKNTYEHTIYGLINERVNAGRTLTRTDAFPLTTTDASITTLQAPSVDRPHEHLGLPFRDHDSQIAVTLMTGAFEILGHGVIAPRRRRELDRL